MDKAIMETFGEKAGVKNAERREKLLREQEKCNLLGPVAATFTMLILVKLRPSCEF